MTKDTIHIPSNRKWQRHFKAKGFIPFMHDRLQSYALGGMNQYDENPFNFAIRPNEENLLAQYFFEFVEEFPYDITIEVTNNCNLNCVFCARQKMSREKGFMSMDLYKNIIDEIASKRPFSYVHLYGIGEPTIDPDIIERIVYAIQKGVTNLIIFTNGKNLLENDFYKKLADTGIGTIGIDVDAFTSDTYGRIRVGGSFDRLIAGITALNEYITENKLNTRVELAYQVYDAVNQAEFSQFQEWALEHDYEYKIVAMHQWAGLREDIECQDSHRSHERQTPCSALWSSFMILWNGDVAVCFQDANGCELMGNVANDAIETVWRGKAKEKRKAHVKGTFTGLCKNCKEYLYNNLPPCNSSVYPEDLTDD